MSYLRPLSLQPDSLKSACLDVWLRHLAGLIRDDAILSRRHRNRRLDEESGERKMPHSISVQSFSENNKVLVIIDMKDEPSEDEEPNFDFDGDKDYNVKSSRFLRPDYLRRYLNSSLPPALQEEAYHRGVQLLRKDFVAHNAFNNDLFPRFFGLMWRSTFKHLDLPPIKDVADRLGVLERVRDAFEDGKAIAERTETAKFRLFDNNHNSGEPPDIEESYLMKRILRSMANLRVLVLWHVADDAILNIVGSTCLRLETLDLWKSAGVTDLGLKMMFTKDMDENYAKKMDFDELPPCCHTLMRLGLKETSVTHIGCLVALIRCANLEVLNFSHTSIVRDFYSQVQRLYREDEEEKSKSESEDESPRKRRRKKLWTKERGYGLKSLFLPLHQEDSFSQIIESFPKLEDLRLWTSINRLRELDKRKLPASLRSLLLGGLHSSQILKDLITVIGVQLTTLKIETVLSAVPLHLVGETCPNLVELQVINGRLTCCDVPGDDLRGREMINNPPLIAPTPKCISGEMPESYLAKLRLVYLFLVNYDDNNNANTSSGADNALHCILKHARNIEAVQATGSPTFTDASLSAAFKVNPMTNLKRFILTNASIAHTTNNLGHPGGNFSLENNLDDDDGGERTSLALTKTSVLNLFEKCKHLQCIGDLRHWRVTPAERRELTKVMAEKTDIRWIATSAH